MAECIHLWQHLRHESADSIMEPLGFLGLSLITRVISDPSELFYCSHCLTVKRVPTPDQQPVVWRTTDGRTMTFARRRGPDGLLYFLVFDEHGVQLSAALESRDALRKAGLIR